MWKKLRSRALLILELCLDLLLLVLFSAQAFIAGCLLIYGYIPAPTEWTNQKLLEQKFDGFYIQAESFRLKLDGEIELIDLKVYHGEMKDSILDASSTALQYTLSKDGEFQFTPTSLVLSNGTLQMPAIYAPDGKRTAILENVAFHLTPTEGLIQVDSIAAQHEDIRLRGSIDWPIQASDATDAKPPIERFYKLIATTLKEKTRFSPFIKPTLEFALTAGQDRSVDVSAHLSCEELKYIHATGTNFNFQANFTLKDGTFIPQTPLLLRAKEINIPKFDLSAKAITGYVTQEEWSELLNGIWPDIEISAYQLTTHDVELSSPKAKISPAHFPEITFSGSTSGLNGGVAFDGKLNSATQSGELHANGSIDVLTLFPESALTKLPRLQSGSNPYYDLSINLSEGFQLNSTTFRIDANDITVDSLTFDHILAEGSYQEGFFSLDRALVDRGKQWIDATFSLDNTTKDFKITLCGSALPDQYSPLLPHWWPGIFQDIDFNPDTLGYGEFVIYGNATPESEIFFLGHATATDVAYKKAHIDEGELIVRGRGNYVELHNIDAKTGDGWAKGNVGFTSGDRGLVSVRYDFDTVMPLDVASKVFGGSVATIISDFEVTKLPRVKLDGATFTEKYAQYQQSNYFNIDAKIDSSVSFKKTPLDHLQFSLYNRDSSTYLRDVEFGYADGHGTAQIDITQDSERNHQLRFDVTLRGANQAKAVRNLPSFDGIEDHLTNEQSKEELEIQSHGKLDLNLHAEGPVDNVYGYNGYGDFIISNDQLGAIQLLGPLSSLLKDTRLSFTSFNLDKMAATFSLAEEELNISELIIDGPRTRIWIDGTFQLPDQALDMYVRVNLFANMGAPDSTIHSLRKLITSPLPNLLVFDLSGTIQDQQIRLSYDPRKLIPVIKDL